MWVKHEKIRKKVQRQKSEEEETLDWQAKPYYILPNSTDYHTSFVNYIWHIIYDISYMH